jgi:magnesium chelatase accessory protein
MSVLDVTPSLIVGHSAGAAIAVHMASQQLCAASGILSINGAFEPFGSIAAPIFTRAAAWLAGNPFIQHTTSLHGYFQRPIRKLLEETGSQPSPEMIRAYQTLIRKPEHVAGTLKMMAGWDLTDMTEWLAQLDIPLWLAAASGDKTVSPEQSKRAARASPQGEFMAIPRLGHLAHEERPEYFASLIERLFARTQ